MNTEVKFHDGLTRNGKKLSDEEYSNFQETARNLNPGDLYIDIDLDPAIQSTVVRKAVLASDAGNGSLNHRFVFWTARIHVPGN